MFRLAFTETIFPILFTLALTLFTWILFYPAWLSAGAEKIEWEEKKTSKRCKVLLSLVIPAYNEEDRITSMMRCTHQFLMKSEKGKDVLKKLKECAKLAGYEEVGTEGIVEWIVVDDGSTDKTCSVVEVIYESFDPNDTCRLLSLRENRGKG